MEDYKIKVPTKTKISGLVIPDNSEKKLFKFGDTKCEVLVDVTDKGLELSITIDTNVVFTDKVLKQILTDPRCRA